MITLHVSLIHGVKVDIDKVLSRSKKVHWDVKEGEEKEHFSIPVARRIGNPTNLASLVMEHKYPKKVSNLALDSDWITQEETTEVAIGLTRICFGDAPYTLFLFRGDSPGREYPYHRLLFARCLGLEEDDLDQNFIKPVNYDLPGLQRIFPEEIWDQDFNRNDPIRKGRIRGSAIEKDVLYKEFSDIKSFIGITVPIKKHLEKIKVLTGGRIQFMSWQAAALENEKDAEDIFKKIFEILKTIEPCRNKNE